MKKVKILLLLTAIILVLTGCFEVETAIKLKKNGSGTMEETVLFSQMMMMQMAQMGQAFGGEEEENANENPMYDVEKLKAEASQKGEGVTYASSEAVERNGKSGYKVIYNFKDINTLKYNNDPSKKMSMPTMGMEAEEEEFIRFQYKKGELIINFPDVDDDSDEYDEGEEEDFDQEDQDEDANEMAGMDEMVKQMFTDMKFKTTIEFEGGISKTNATYVEGNKITLMAMDFNQVMENPEAFKTLGGLQSATPAEQKEAMKNLPGVKFETEEKITVKF